MTVNERVREAINRIEPIPHSDGPNFFSVKVDGWSLNAPTRPAVAAMLWDWFTNEDTKERFGEIDALMAALGEKFA